jgi:hypothetical protein
MTMRATPARQRSGRQPDPSVSTAAGAARQELRPQEEPRWGQDSMGNMRTARRRPHEWRHRGSPTSLPGAHYAPRAQPTGRWPGAVNGAQRDRRIAPARHSDYAYRRREDTSSWSGGLAMGALRSAIASPSYMVVRCRSGAGCGLSRLSATKKAHSPPALRWVMADCAFSRQLSRMLLSLRVRVASTAYCVLSRI